MTLKEVVYQYIDTCYEGIQCIRKVNHNGMTEKQRGRLEDAEIRLYQIREVVGQVTDEVTLRAVEDAKVIIAKIKEWSMEALYPQSNCWDLDLLEEAFLAAGIWRDSKVKKSLFSKPVLAKPEDFPVYEPYGLEEAASISDGLSKADAFHKRLYECMDVLQEPLANALFACETADLKETIIQKKAELEAEKKKLLETIFVKVKKGELDAATAVVRSEEIKANIQRLTTELEDSENGLYAQWEARKEANVECTKEDLECAALIRSFLKIDEVLQECKGNPELFSMMIEKIDFEEMNGYLDMMVVKQDVIDMVKTGKVALEMKKQTDEAAEFIRAHFKNGSSISLD